ncbi:TIGR01777 family oxidoreductase [Marinomonas sp. TW1]|uniref:TIGR01777 family oxidoreductase n=1 Tax=Marinomonas sp. TW1 TaxID=1561203 RepID=UPI0007AF0105|nr:TIGR01777 family oxidoreductase [Marinomonas sp. TW1]KZN13186.1 hypothetical protein OA79_12110 [Marinomonas sp. TW1]
MKILMTGATGFIGRSLLDELLKTDSEICALVRKKSNSLPVAVKQIDFSALSQLTEPFDVFINLAGESIAAQRWTSKRKQALLNSRVNLTNRIFDLLQQPPKTIISMSAIGYYGVTNEGEFTESTLPASGFAHQLCELWERSVTESAQHDSRVVIFRLGVVLGNGGALNAMRLPYRLGLGGKIASGKQWFNWVHLDDVKQCILNAVTDTTYQGSYNLVAPNNATQAEFASGYAKCLKRPALVWTPQWVLKVLLGEMSTLLTHGPKVIPDRLVKQGYQFKFDRLDQALNNIEANNTQ